MNSPNITIKSFRQEVAEAPLRILRQQTRQILGASLDSHKLLLSETKLHRDWRGLAEKANLDTSIIRSSKISSTEHCLHLWIQKGAFVKDVLEALEYIDRYDVIDDTLHLMYEDYDYAMSKDVLRLKPILPSLEDIQPSITDFDSNVLTTDDQKNLTDGGTLQFYDALVLFADEDLDFVDTMVQKLEGEYKLKLCLKDRDLVGGLAFESSAVARLIEERCARVVVVLSPAFLLSKANTFLTQFAHALSIDKQRRIVIPCMYKPCQKPSEISFCHSLDYFRTKGFWDYWKKLADSIVYQQSTSRPSNAPAPPRPVIRELPPSSPSPSSPLPSPSPQPLPPRSTPASDGVLSRIRKRTEEWNEKRTSKQNEVPPAAKKDASQRCSERSSNLSISLPPSPDGSDARSENSFGSGSRRSSPLASPTFSTAPLLERRPSAEGTLRNILKKVSKFRKKKVLA